MSRLRRIFVWPLSATIVGLLLLAAPFSADAQRTGTVPRIGFLLSGPPATNQHNVEALRQGLRELGYVEGKNIVIEHRYGENKLDRLPDLAAELVRLKVDVIVSLGPPSAWAAKNATRTTPVVFVAVGDVVEAGFIDSLARPGGNVTGLTTMTSDVIGKQFELLKEAMPAVSRVAVLWNPSTPAHRPALKQVKSAVATLGLPAEFVEARSIAEIDASFATMARQHLSGVLVMRDPLFVAQRAQIATLAAKNRLPAIYGLHEHVEAGGLMAYGASVPDMTRRAASFVAKILTGAKPADLPVEQPTKFDFVINLKAAKALGLTIPQSLVLRADRVIE